MINVVLKMNRVTIRNTNLFFAMKEFSEKLIDCVIISLMNLFLKYNQLSLIKKSKKHDCLNDVVRFNKNDYDFHENN